MTRTVTRTLAEERDRLDRQLDELVDQLADADLETPTAQQLMQEARDVEEAGTAVGTLIDRHGEDAEVTVRELNGILWAEAEDRVTAVAESKPGPGGAPATARNIFAGQTLMDAPFVNGEVDPEDLQAMTRVVGEQTPAPGVAKWLTDLLDDIEGADSGNWTPLEQRFAAKAASTTSDS